ncbi:MAG: hypothetical protein AAGN35_26850 [Bacteroidota bacterium]
MQLFKSLIVCALLAVLTYRCEKEIVTPEQNLIVPALSGSEDLIRPDFPCGASEFTDLKDDLGNSYGDVEILNDQDNVYLLIEMEQGKFLDVVQVFFGTQTQIPNDGNGSILMENAQFQSVITRGASLYTVAFPLNGLPTCTDIVFRAQVSEKNVFGQNTNTTTAWLTGIPVMNGNYFKYCHGACGTNVLTQDVVE